MEKQLEEHLDDWIDQMLRTHSRDDIKEALEQKLASMEEEDSDGSKENEGD
jgi:hypothetical protein